MDNLLYPSTQALLLLSATYQIFSFTEIYGTFSGTFPLGSGVVTYFLFLFQVQNGLITTRSWLVSAVLLLELGKIPTQNKHHHHLLHAVLFSLCIAFWSTLGILYITIDILFRNHSFILFIFLIIHATLFAKFLLLDLTSFSLGLKKKSWIWVNFKWFIVSFSNSGNPSLLLQWRVFQIYFLYLKKKFHCIYLLFCFIFKFHWSWINLI